MRPSLTAWPGFIRLARPVFCQSICFGDEAGICPHVWFKPALIFNLNRQPVTEEQPTSSCVFRTAMLLHTSVNVGKALEGCALFASGLTLGSTFYITAIEIPGRRSASAGYQLQNYQRIFPRCVALLKPFGMLVNLEGANSKGSYGCLIKMIIRCIYCV